MFSRFLVVGRDRRALRARAIASVAVLAAVLVPTAASAAPQSVTASDPAGDVVDAGADPISDPSGDLRSVTVSTAGTLSVEVALDAAPASFVLAAGFRSPYGGATVGFTALDDGTGGFVATFTPTTNEQCVAGSVSGLGTTTITVTVPYTCLDPAPEALVEVVMIHDGFDVIDSRLRVATEGGGAKALTSLIDGDPATTERLLTDDPVVAATLVSKSVFPDAQRPAFGAVLVRSDIFPDALTGAALAGALHGPLLFTGGDALPSTTRAELERILVNGDPVYLLGGTAAIGDGVRTELEGMGFQVTRLAGKTRVGTSIAVANEVAPVQGRVFVARAIGPSGDPNGTAAWADSIAIAPYVAGSNGSAVVVLVAESLTADHETLLGRIDPTEVTLLGGTAAVSASVESELVALGYPTRRVAGTNRAETASAIIDEVWAEVGPFTAGRPATGPRAIAVINGYASNGWAFGLAGAIAAGSEFMPYVLSQRDGVPPATQLESTSCDGVPQVETWIIGGFSQVSSTTEAAFDGYDPASACG